MSALLLRAASTIVRGWTQLYTRGLPPDARERRRAEIESELWECRAGASRPASAAAHMLIRLVLGMVDDVGWSMENRNRHPRRTIAVAAAATVLLTLIWIGAAFTVEPVTPPPVPRFTTRHVDYRPPPPPPPPPCRLADPSPVPPCR